MGCLLKRIVRHCLRPQQPGALSPEDGAQSGAHLAEEQLGALGRAGLPAQTYLVYVNSFAASRYMVDRCASLRLAPSISIFHPRFLLVPPASRAARALTPGPLL